MRRTLARNIVRVSTLLEEFRVWLDRSHAVPFDSRTRCVLVGNSIVLAPLALTVEDTRTPQLKGNTMTTTKINHHLAHRPRRGYTLIEGVVVLIVITILMSMAISQFGGSSSGATTVEARSTAQNAIASAASLFGSTGQLPANAAALTQFNPDTNFVSADTPSTDPSVASAATSTGGTVFAAAVLGASNMCEMESWTTNDQTLSTTPTLYAVESTSVSGFSCDGTEALRLSSCPTTSVNNGQSWNAPLLCTL